jgi:hypothetical protein
MYGSVTQEISQQGRKPKTSVPTDLFLDRGAVVRSFAISSLIDEPRDDSRRLAVLTVARVSDTAHHGGISQATTNAHSVLTNSPLSRPFTSREAKP